MSRVRAVVLRFFLIGYGVGVLAGLGTGFVFGPGAGWLVAWLGGGCLGLVLAFVWYWRAQRRQTSLAEMLAAWDRDTSEERLAADLRAEAAQAARAEKGPRKTA